jgi:hypothetical protein
MLASSIFGHAIFGHVGVRSKLNSKEARPVVPFIWSIAILDLNSGVLDTRKAKAPILRSGLAKKFRYRVRELVRTARPIY